MDPQQYDSMHGTNSEISESMIVLQFLINTVQIAVKWVEIDIWISVVSD